MHNKLFLFFSLSCIALLSYGQVPENPVIDSLQKVVQKMPEDTNKVKTLNDLAFEYAYHNPDEGIRTGEMALTLATKLHWKSGEARAHSVIGSNYANKADYANALKYELKSLDMFEQQNDLRNQAILLRNIGIVYSRNGEFEKALETYDKSMAIYRTINNWEGEAGVYGNMANTYYNMEQMEKVLESNLNALSIYQKNNYRKGEALILGNIGNYYAETGAFGQSMPYYFAALRAERGLKNQNGVIRNLGNIGETYFDISKQPESAIKSDSLIPAGSKANLQKAILYLQQCVDGAVELKQTEYILAFQEVLSEAYKAAGNTDKSFDLYKNYIAVRDSVINLENSKKILQTQMQYAFDKKAAEAAADQEKKDIRQKGYRSMLAGGSVLLIIIIVILANRYRIKQRSNKALAAALKDLQEAQAQLVKSERMAALGMMTSRMAHEIYNPLNFVNNFSLLSLELVPEFVHAQTDAERNKTGETLTENIEKIVANGKRAADIIHQLQEHIRTGTAHTFFEEENN